MATRNLKTSKKAAPAKQDLASRDKTTTKKVAFPRKAGSASGGKKTETAVSLDPRVFSYKANDALLAQVIHVYRDNLHQDTSKVKTRGELTKTTKKMFKQKGTGNARHGSKMAPQFVGGGIAHGPTGITPANLKVNRKMKAAALAGLLSLYRKNNNVELITLPEVKQSKLKEVSPLFPKEKTLLVYGSEGAVLTTSLRNLANVNLVNATELNAYDVANFSHIALTPSGHDSLVSRLTPLLNAPAKQDLASPDKK